MTAAHAPGAGRALTRDADIAEEEAVAVDTAWPARARQWIYAKVGAPRTRAKCAVQAAVVAALDKCIAGLQRLRKRAGGAERQDERRERGRSGTRATATPAADDATVETAIERKPRRLRTLLICLCILLAGGMLGTALAYDLLAQLLDRRGAEIERDKAKLARHSKSVAALKTALEKQQAGRAATEEKLAAALADAEKKTGELQTQRAEAEAHLARALAARSAGQQSPDTGGGKSAQGGWTRSVNCALGSGDVRSALAGCVADMNRK